MSTKISLTVYNEVFQLVELNQNLYLQSNDSETILVCPQQLGKRYVLDIELRNGFYLTLENYHIHEHLIVDVLTRKHPLEFAFWVSGDYREQLDFTRSDATLLCGSGMATQGVCEFVPKEHIKEIVVYIESIWDLFMCQPLEH